MTTNPPLDFTAPTSAEYGPDRRIAWDERQIEYRVRRRAGARMFGVFAVLSAVLLGLSIAFLPLGGWGLLIDIFFGFVFVVCIRELDELDGEPGDATAFSIRVDDRGAELRNTYPLATCSFAWDEVVAFHVDDLGDQLRLYVSVRGESSTRDLPFEYIVDLQIVAELVARAIDVDLTIPARLGGNRPGLLAEAFPSLPVGLPERSDSRSLA